ncbi:MAG: hypothetical protein HFF24_10010 [Oscillospiraceae bacterium]|nr:hypothetical protein [Oscillospiraceae bacterium]
MERNFKRISDGLKLPQESRERIRFQLASYQKQSEDIPMKKSTLKSRVPLIAVAVVMMMALTLTAAAAVVVHLFRNDIIVSSRDDIPTPSSENGAPGAVGITSPGGTPPAPLEEMIESSRQKTDDWSSGTSLGGGVIAEYAQWDFVDVLSSDPSLRSRRVGREDGAEKMEYTAENPANLLDTLTARVTFDLEWLNEHYDYVPDANLSFVVLDVGGSYVSELFDALYAKKDGSGYVEVEIHNVAQADYWGQSYIIDGSYETAYYYTSADGYEFLIRMHNGRVWADCNTSHASISLYGAYLTTDEVEDILDNLSLTINE